MVQSPHKAVKPVRRRQVNRLLLFALLGLAGILLLCLAVGAALWLLSPQLADLPLPLPTSLQFASQATPTATLACGEPTLSLGITRFRIGTLPRLPDGSFVVPPEPSATAYWVKGTTPHYLFALSPTPENLIPMLSAQVGESLTIQWADCGLETYQVRTLLSGQSDLSPFYSQPESGVTLAVQDDSGAWIVLDSGWPQVPQAAETPIPPEGVLQAEISFLDSISSPDGQTLTLVISIKNLGDSPIGLSPSDISLTPEGGVPLPLLSVEPALPLEVAPGASQDLRLQFAHPPAGAAVFKLLDFSAEFYY